MMFRMPTHVDKYRNTLAVKQRTWQTVTQYLWGPTGTGKSTRLLEISKLYDEDDVYWVSAPSGDRVWFEGYVGQPIVMMDELTGAWFKYGLLLNLLGNTPFMVEYKQSATPWLAEMVFISSNHSPELLYKNESVPDITALKRRLSGVCGEEIFMNEPYVHPMANGPTASDIINKKLADRKLSMDRVVANAAVVDLTVNDDDDDTVEIQHSNVNYIDDEAEQAEDDDDGITSEELRLIEAEREDSSWASSHASQRRDRTPSPENVLLGFKAPPPRPSGLFKKVGAGKQQSTLDLKRRKIMVPMNDDDDFH